MTWFLSYFHKPRIFFHQNCCLLIFSKDFWLRIKIYKTAIYLHWKSQTILWKNKNNIDNIYRVRESKTPHKKKSLSIWITYTVTKMLIQEIQCCNWSFARLTFITGPLMTTSIAPFSSFVSVTSVVELRGAE